MRVDPRLLTYGVAIGATAISLLLSLWIEPLISRTIGTFFYIAIIVSTWYGGSRPGMVTVVLSTLAVDYFLIPPRYQIMLPHGEDILRLGFFFAVALIIKQLTSNFLKSKQKIQQLGQELAQENAQQLRMALSAAQMGMWDWDMVTGEINWSPEHEQLFGLTPGSFNGKYETFATFLHPEDSSLVNQAVQEALQTHSMYQFEYRVIWADGSIHWVEGRGQAFYNEAGQPVRMTGTVMAIDERKQAQNLLQEQLEQQRLVMEMSQHIRRSLNLQEILQTTVDEVRQFLGCDRAIIFKFLIGWGGTTLVESVVPEWMSILSMEIYDPCIGEENIELFKKGIVTAKADIYQAGISPCHVEFLANLQVRANLVVPILLGNQLWGLLAAHHCAAPREWKSSEIALLRQLGEQVSIAVQQADLFEQVQTQLTQRQQAEAALRESQIQLQRQLAEIETIYQSAPIGLSVLDTDLRFVRINERLAQMNGFPVEAHIGHTIRELLPNLTDIAEQLLGSILATGKPVLNVEITGETPAQPGFQRTWVESFLPLKDGERIIGISTVCEEITDRKRAEQTLREREATLRLFVQYAPAGIAMFDRHMHYVIASQRWVDDHNLDRVESLIGRSHYEIFPEISERWRQIHQRCLAGASEKCEEDLFVRLDGTQQWIRWEIHPWHNAMGEVGGIIIFGDDITMRKQAQIALERLNVELEQRVAQRTEKLKEISDRLLETVIEQQQTQMVLLEQTQLLDLAHDTIMTRDLNGVITFWNEGAEYMYGWKKATALGQIAHTLLKTQFPQPKQEIEAQLLASGYWEGELTHIRHDGRPVAVASRWVLQTDSAGTPIKILEINNDITERKQAQAALQQYVREVEDLYNNAPCGYHSLNAEGIFIRINDTELEWLGYTHDEILRKKFLDILTFESKQLFQDSFPKFKQQGWVNNLEFEIVSKDNTTRWVSVNATAIKDAAGNFVMSRSTVFDISQQQAARRDRQRIEDALRQSEEKFRQLAENIDAVFWIKDHQSQQILYVSPAYETIWQRSCQNLYQNSLTWLNAIHPDDHTHVNTTFIEQVKGQFDVKYRIIRPDGSMRWIRDRAFPIKNELGEVVRIAGIAEDITEQQKIEQIKNEFISIVSHELRTPLTSIRAALGLLNTGIYDKKPDKFKRMIEIAAIDSDRLVRLVNDILDLERLESGRAVLEKTPCKAADLIAQAVDGVQAIAKQQNITFNIHPKDAQVWVAADAIIQTLTNLLGNAIKFSPANSTITLTVQQQTDHVLFQVTDQGRGIPTDKLEAIFGRFQQVDGSDSRAKGGTGLGLAICRSIIDQHGGQIWAESTVDVGSTFFFTLPNSGDC